MTNIFNFFRMGNQTSVIKEDMSRLAKQRIQEEMKELAQTKPPDPISLKQFVQNSNKFPVKFPIETARVSSQVSYIILYST